VTSHRGGAGDLRSVRRLECVECGRISREGERGWRAYLTARRGGACRGTRLLPRMR
jgi:hypothetical protein